MGKLTPHLLRMLRDEKLEVRVKRRESTGSSFVTAHITWSPTTDAHWNNVTYVLRIHLSALKI